MKRSHAAWLVGCALIFAEYGCAADATGVATTTAIVTEETEPPIAHSSDPSPESEGETDQGSSSTNWSVVETVAPIRIRPGEELLGPQPVPWCTALVCGTIRCPCFPFFADGTTPIDLGTRTIPTATDAERAQPTLMRNDPEGR